MRPAIEEVCRARLCLDCQLQMEQTHLLRCDGQMRRAACERCGAEKPTLAYRYLMRGAELRRRGLA